MALHPRGLEAEQEAQRTERGQGEAVSRLEGSAAQIPRIGIHTPECGHLTGVACPKQGNVVAQPPRILPYLSFYLSS